MALSTGQQALDLVTDVLAVKRLTRLINEDVILEPARDWLFKRIGQPHENKLAYLITCPHCLSIWLAAGVVVGRRVLPKAWSPVARALALSAVTSLIAERE